MSCRFLGSLGIGLEDALSFSTPARGGRQMVISHPFKTQTRILLSKFTHSVPDSEQKMLHRRTTHERQDIVHKTLCTWTSLKGHDGIVTQPDGKRSYRETDRKRTNGNPLDATSGRKLCRIYLHSPLIPKTNTNYRATEIADRMHSYQKSSHRETENRERKREREEHQSITTA